MDAAQCTHRTDKRNRNRGRILQKPPATVEWRVSDATVEWRVSDAPLNYPQAVASMEARVAAIRAGTAAEQVWLVEHPPLYTAGISARPTDLIDPNRLPVFKTGRGGQYTYHGPGQRVAYVMLDLAARTPDIRKYVADLEQWAIDALAQFGVRGERREGRVGIWVPRKNGREDKIAAIGVRVRRWVTYHGIAVNRAPDLSHFDGIVPCGIAAPNTGVTSLADLGLRVSAEELDEALRQAFTEIFGPVSGGDERSIP